MAIANFPLAFSWGTTATTSDALDISGSTDYTFCGFFIPSSFSGTSVSFTVSTSLTGTYFPMTDEYGANISYVVAASKYVRCKPTDFAGVRFIKMVSGSSETAGRSVTVAARKID